MSQVFHVRSSRVVKKLAPGRPGTLRAQRTYGDALVCVRYRHDALKLYRFTTIELVIDAAPIHSRRFDIATFGVHIEPAENHLHAALRAAGARWDGRARLWWTRGTTIRQFDLLDRIRAL